MEFKEILEKIKKEAIDNRRCSECDDTECEFHPLRTKTTETNAGISKEEIKKGEDIARNIKEEIESQYVKELSKRSIDELIIMLNGIIWKEANPLFIAHGAIEKTLIADKKRVVVKAIAKKFKDLEDKNDLRGFVKSFSEDINGAMKEFFESSRKIEDDKKMVGIEFDINLPDGPGKIYITIKGEME
jgi:hypothetical protein